MNPIRNKYAGYCHRCGDRVPEGAGFAVKPNGRWLVEHAHACQVRAVPPRQVVPPRPTAHVGDLAGIMKLFARARAHLKMPAVEIGVPAFPAVRINVAGDQAKVPGSLTLLSADKSPPTAQHPYGERAWLGRIMADGTFQPAMALRDDPPYLAGVTARLQAFALDPSKVGGDDGRLHGRCCFCRQALTDARSTAAGYGETCAAHWGLEWGGLPAEFAGPATAPKARKRRVARPVTDAEADGAPVDDLSDLWRGAGFQVDGDGRVLVADKNRQG